MSEVMTKANCKEVRRELDEMMLSADYGVQVSTHLRECNDCRDFQEKQTRLRQIVGGLGTVSAPPDFDFRLRSRLANENASSGFPLSSLFSFGQRSAAVAAVLVLLVALVVLVRYVGTRNSSTPTVAHRDEVKPDNLSPSQPKPSQEIVTPEKHQEVAVVPRVTNKDIKRSSTVGNQRSRPNFAVEDSSGTGARVIGPLSASETEQVFPVDASSQSLKVSLFDGRGNAKTISVPSVSFGSQRVVPTSASYAPKGVW
jgi:hypothetical protein